MTFRAPEKVRHIGAGKGAHGLPRIDQLRAVPARVRFRSIEPLLEDLGDINLEGIHWVIVGGESGAGARPIEKAWVLSIRDQCERAQVPFFFKQWGGVRKSKAGRSSRAGSTTGCLAWNFLPHDP
jgi:protein gp37